MGKLNIKTIQKLAIKGIVTTKTYWSMKKLLKPKNRRASYIRQPFKLQQFSEDECRLNFRFTYEEIEILMECLKIPQMNWLENRKKFSGKEGLCILLRRLSYPNRLSDLVSMFKRDEGTISRIINFMLKQNYLTPEALQELADNSIEKGCPYPNIVRFIDGTCRPVYGDPGYSNQKYIKVGYKNHRTLKSREIQFNRMMSSLRVGVEYGFGEILQQFAYLDFKKSQKQYLSSLKEMYFVAAFLINCQVCIRCGNQISNIFGSYTPTLQEHLMYPVQIMGINN